MSTITIPQNVEIGGGALITFKGTPNKCAYWEVVGVDGASETTPIGALFESITVNDINGLSVNRYVSSTTPGDSGKVERIRVRESA